MKYFSCVFGFLCAYFAVNGAFAVSAGTVSAADKERAMVLQAPAAASNANNNSNSNVLRGNAAVANTYKNNQRNVYFIVNQPDVDTACREKIFKCLTDYCGDTTVVSGVPTTKCQYATESELYNYAMLCLQKDTEILLPQYGANTKNYVGGMNTAAQLCPSYVQQELMSYLSMANMANQLSKSHSDLCLKRRQELEAAMACHSIALAYGNETNSKLTALLTDYCGAGVPGGSAEMVARFSNAGNVGGNIWGWAEKIVSLDLSNKGTEWQVAVDAVLASYTNRMNLACGDNLQLNAVQHATQSTGNSALQTVAAAVVSNIAFPNSTAKKIDNPYANQPIWMDVQSMSELYKYEDAYQVVMAGMYNPPHTPNAFLNSAQMDSMQRAYTQGTKVFIIRDSARCYIVPVQTLTAAEQSLVAQNNANCFSN